MPLGAQPTPVEWLHAKQKLTLSHWTWAALNYTASLSQPGPWSGSQQPRAGQAWKVAKQMPPMSCSPWQSPTGKYLCGTPCHTRRLPIYKELAGEPNSEQINKDVTCCHFRKIADWWLDASESTAKKHFWADVFSSDGFFHPLPASALNWKGYGRHPLKNLTQWLQGFQNSSWVDIIQCCKAKGRAVAAHSDLPTALQTSPLRAVWHWGFKFINS